MARFKRGQKVVCVDIMRADGKPHRCLTLGAVYVIRNPDAKWPPGTPTEFATNPPWVTLVGIRKGTLDTPFAESRFEPLEPKYQSIGIFRKLLTPKIKEDA